MNRVWSRGILPAVFAAAMIGAALWRCGGDLRSGLGLSGTKEPMAQTRLSVWVADWDYKLGAADWASLSGSPESVQLFGAYFDERDKLLFRDDFFKLLEAVQRPGLPAGGKAGYERYLTIVNDIVKGDATSLLKDSGLVSRLAASESSRKAHIAAVVAAAKQYGMDGIELDYERVAQADWPNVVRLFGELHRALAAEWLKLRIVLEPGAPVERLELPEGPEYVMMAYNLYGTHSGPGPKTDLAYIGKLAKRLEHVPGAPVLAFATGGFDWDAAGKATALMETDAIRLAQAAGVQPQRDEASGSLYFTYTDWQGAEHTVWYADAATLQGWIDAAKQRGVTRAAIWRMGGLSKASLDYLGSL